MQQKKLYTQKLHNVTGVGASGAVSNWLNTGDTGWATCGASVGTLLHGAAAQLVRQVLGNSHRGGHQFPGHQIRKVF